MWMIHPEKLYFETSAYVLRMKFMREKKNVGDAMTNKIEHKQRTNEA